MRNAERCTPLAVLPFLLNIYSRKARQANVCVIFCPAHLGASEENSYLGITTNAEFATTMQRRDIFNMLLGKTADKPLTRETVSPVGMPEQLETEPTKLFSDDYLYIYANQHIGHDLITTFPFELTVYHTKDSDTDTTFSVGSVELGVDESGYLFIGNIRGKQMLNNEKLNDYYQLILSVNPIDKGFSHARLKLIDESGLTLAIVKTDEVMQTQWASYIEIKGNGINRLQVQGRKKITI